MTVGVKSKAAGVLLLAAVLGLGGCATNRTVNKSAPTITIDGVLLGNVSEAYDVADAHCASYGNDAQMLDDDESDGTITFACVY
jgi:hypothetical protein